MRKLTRVLLVFFIVCSAAAAQTQTKLLPESDTVADIEQELARVDQLIAVLLKESGSLQSQRDRFQIKGESYAIFSQLTASGAGKDKMVDFDGFPLDYDALESNAQAAGIKANQGIRLQLTAQPVRPALPHPAPARPVLTAQPAAGLKIASDLQLSQIWPFEGSVALRGISVAMEAKQLETAIGDFQSQFTPLTLWNPLWESDYEAAIFQQSRQYKWEQAEQSSGKRALKGARLDYTGQKLQGNLFVASLRSQPSQRLMSGIELNTPGLVRGSTKSELGISGVSVNDYQSAASSALPMRNDVGSMWFRIETPKAQAAFEVAKSSYDPGSSAEAGAIKGQGLRAELTSFLGPVKAAYSFLAVSPDYYAFGAQSRSPKADTQLPYGWNPADKPGYPELLTFQGNAQDSILAKCEALPYGPATPNRRLSILSASFSPFAGSSFEIVRLAGKEQTSTIDVSANAVGSPVSFYESLKSFVKNSVGCRVPFGEKYEVSALYQSDSVSRADSIASRKIDLKSKTADLGFAWQLNRQLAVMLGYKRQSVSGKVGQNVLDSHYRTGAVGLGWRPSEDFQYSVTYQLRDCVDDYAVENNYRASQVKMSVSLFM